MSSLAGPIEGLRRLQGELVNYARQRRFTVCCWIHLRKSMCGFGCLFSFFFMPGAF